MPPAPRPPQAQWPRRLARGAIAALATMALLELATWVFFAPLAGVAFDRRQLEVDRRAHIALADARLAGAGETGGGALMQFHPYLGYTRRPGSRLSAAEPSTANAFGMWSLAGHPYPYARRPGELVIGVVGGSAAEIFANSYESDLQAALAELDPRYKTLRAVMLPLAIGGYKQPQQLLALEYALLSGFEFDLVLNIDGFNDLVLAAENRKYGIHPLFPSGFHLAPLAEGLRASPDPRSIRLVAEVLTAFERERRVLALIQSPPWNYSVFLNAFGARFSRYSQRRIDRLQAELARIAQEGLDPAFRGPPLAVDADPVTVAVDTWRQGSEMLNAICRDRGIPYVHVLQPNQYVEGTKPLSDHEREVAYDADNPWGHIARRHYGRLIDTGAALKAHGVPFYDLTGLFKDVPDDIYIDNCCHFGPAGNRMLAREVARAIVEQLDRPRKRP